MNLAETAYKAADLLAEHGHAKSIAQDQDGSMCIGGAVSMAVCGDAWDAWFATGSPFSKILGAVSEILYERGEVTAVNDIMAVYWNNRRETSQEDVIQVLKEAGKRLEDAGL